MTAALYARISTHEGKQHLESQLRELRLYAARRGWTLYGVEFVDAVSGASADRPGLEALLAQAAAGRFDLVLVFDLSRLTRKGPASAFQIIERLKASGVDFFSLKEEHFRTLGPAGTLLIAIAAYIAEQERLQISNRINAGLARAREQGKKFGRPAAVVDLLKVQQLRADGFSLRQCADILRVSKNTIDRRTRVEQNRVEQQKEHTAAKNPVKRETAGPTMPA